MGTDLVISRKGCIYTMTPNRTTMKAKALVESLLEGDANPFNVATGKWTKGLYGLSDQCGTIEQAYSALCLEAGVFPSRHKEGGKFTPGKKGGKYEHDGKTYDVDEDGNFIDENGHEYAVDENGEEAHPIKGQEEQEEAQTKYHNAVSGPIEKSGKAYEDKYEQIHKESGGNLEKIASRWREPVQAAHSAAKDAVKDLPKDQLETIVKGSGGKPPKNEAKLREKAAEAISSYISHTADIRQDNVKEKLGIRKSEGAGELVDHLLSEVGGSTGNQRPGQSTPSRSATRKIFCVNSSDYGATKAFASREKANAYLAECQKMDDGDAQWDVSEIEFVE